MDAFALPSDWGNLPEHLLDSISDRLLTSSDYLRFSLVCKSWFGVAKHNQSKHKSHLEPPMLLFFNNKEDAWSLYNVIENKVLDLQFRLPKKRFCGSSKGWLAFVEEDFAVTLIKPFFSSSKNGVGRENVVVRLPQLKPPDMEDIGRDEYWVEDCEYYVIKATITSDPILNPNECVVVLTHMEQCQMAFIRPGKDTVWTYISTLWRPQSIEDVIRRGDETFYALGRHGNLLTFNITPDSNSKVTSLECDILPNTFIRKYLVDLNGKDWLMVDRSCDWEEEELLSRFADEFKVYQFNFDKCLWIEKETLGDDVAIFIGESLSICVAPSKFPGCKKNCIYYNHDFDYMDMDKCKLYDFGVYDMEKKSISKPYSTDVMTLLEIEMINHRPIWFTPTFHL